MTSRKDRVTSATLGSELPAHAPQLGQRVRDIRRGRGMALTTLATQTNLSKGFLSRFERDKASVSVAALLRICDVLDIGASELFSAPHANLVRSTEVPRIAFGGVGLTEYQLTPTTETRMQVLLTEMAPGGGSGDEPYKLPVELEYAHVIQGKVAVVVNGEEVKLSAGDSLTFTSQPHTFRNDGSGTAKLLWMLLPAIFSEDGDGVQRAADHREEQS